MNKTTKSNAPRFTINFIKKEIIGTQASFDKASKGFGSIYEELADKVAKHPDFALTVKEQKRQITRAKRTYDGLDFKLMEDYIAIQKNGETLRREYDAVKAMAKSAGKSLYPITKKWFLDKFSTEKKPFDVKEAKEAITEAMIASATSKVSAPKNNVSDMPVAVNQ